MITLKSLGAAVARMRKAKCLNETEFGRGSGGWGEGTIKRIESGDADLNVGNLTALAQGLRIPTGVMMFLAEDTSDLKGPSRMLIENLQKKIFAAYSVEGDREIEKLAAALR